jgi:hypothetical protein
MSPYNKYFQVLSSVILLTITCLHNDTFAQSTPSITLPFSAQHTPEHPNYYYEEALKLALAKTESSYGKMDIKFYSFETEPERQRAILKTNGGLDLIWSSSSPLREEQMRAIKFNLLRDLSDYRLLLIRTEDKAKFATVKRLADLRKFKAGTVTGRQENKVYQLNNIPSVTAWAYEPLFKMLMDKRFDYILRRPNEIWTELEQRKGTPLMAEETLLIGYPLPVYFFVHNDNEKLAKRIKKGLELAEKDGSLKALFMSLPAFKKGYEEIKKKNRVLINLDDADSLALNPTTHPKLLANF